MTKKTIMTILKWAYFTSFPVDWQLSINGFGKFGFKLRKKCLTGITI